MKKYGNNNSNAKGAISSSSLVVEDDTNSLYSIESKVHRAAVDQLLAE